MTLTAGARLGPYEIVSAIGAGGMGEVYRARDTKLNRDVAIKVLPDTFAGDPDRLARFTREAQVLASLNHPNIAQIYGVEDSTATRALVMELVPGRTLDEIMPVPVGEALTIARQIVEALEAAHEAGVIHRDLKPANIKVREDGTVKVLDFGLAKAMEVTQAKAERSHSFTITSPAMTEVGVILGTAAYMSPEQARGRPVDRRADIWAFGVVLFEMLSGRRLFAGDTVSDTLAAVLREEVPYAALPRDVPPNVTRILVRCLERDPLKRWRDAGDVRLLLDEAPDASRAAASAPSVNTRGRSMVAIGVVALAALLIGGIAGWLLRPLPPAAGAAATVQFTIPAPPGVQRISNVALSSSGAFLVFDGGSRAGGQLYVRRFDSTETKPLPGTQGGEWPFISPDGQSVGFFRGGKLLRVAVDGGDVLTICDAHTGPGAIWLPDNRIVFAGSWLGTLFEVPAEGGTPTALTSVKAADGERGHWWPSPLPDGRLLFTVFMSGSGLNDNKIAVYDPATRTHRVVMNGSRAYWLPSNELLYYRAGRYTVAPFDLASLKVGESRPVLADAVGLDPAGDWPQPVVAGVDGTLAYMPGELVPATKLTWIDAAGKQSPLPLSAHAYIQVVLSPDERRAAAAVIEDGRYFIRLVDLTRFTEEAVNLTGMVWNPTWRSDSRALTVTSMRKGDFDMTTWHLDGAGRETTLLDDPPDTSPVGWLADGRLLFNGSEPNGSYLLKTLEPTTRAQTVVVRDQVGPSSVSGDGRWVAYTKEDSGRPNVYLMPMSGGAAVSVSREGGSDPVFRAGSTDLYYRRGREIYAVTWRASGDLLDISSERRAAASDYLGVTAIDVRSAFAVARDGRILTFMRETPPAPSSVTVVLGWRR